MGPDFRRGDDCGKDYRFNYCRTKPKFAQRFALDPRALQDWEQGRRRPDRAARAYLTVIARKSEAVAAALLSS